MLAPQVVAEKRSKTSQIEKNYLDSCFGVVKAKLHMNATISSEKHGILKMAKTRVPLNQEWELERKREKLLASAVAELPLDVRTVNGLEESGVLYVHELVKLTRVELNKIPNFGAKSVERIIHVLDQNGLAIRNEVRPSLQARK